MKWATRPSGLVADPVQADAAISVSDLTRVIEARSVKGTSIRDVGAARFCTYSRYAAEPARQVNDHAGRQREGTLGIGMVGCAQPRPPIVCAIELGSRQAAIDSGLPQITLKPRKRLIPRSAVLLGEEVPYESLPFGTGFAKGAGFSWIDHRRGCREAAAR